MQIVKENGKKSISMTKYIMPSKTASPIHHRIKIREFSGFFSLNFFKPDPKLDSVIVPYDQNKGATCLIKAIETKRAGRIFTDLLSTVAVQNKINQYRFEKVYYSTLKRNHIAISDICTLDNLNNLIDYSSNQLS